MDRMPEANSFEIFHKYSERLADDWGLASSSDPRLPAIMTSDANTPKKFLALFAQSTEKDILERLASNPNTPEEVLIGLADHYEQSVREATANNNMAPDVVSESLAKDENLNVRFAVASNPHSSTKALEHLSEDWNPYVVRRARKTINKLKAVKPAESTAERIQDTDIAAAGK